MNDTAPNELIAAIAKRMGISVAEATEIVSMVENNPTTQPESAPQHPSIDTGDTFFFEGEETSPTTETTLPTEEAPIHELGRYQNLGILGIGGMGKVHKVLDPSLNRILALKVIHPRLMTMPALVSRFVEEAQIQANLQHPNIVPIHEIGRLGDNRPYFTMRLVQDDPYSEQIGAVHKAAAATQWQPTPNGTTFRDLINAFHQVCVTVAFAHAQGVIHRDLKPDNILIGRFGQVLVVDWGLAKFMGASNDDEEILEQIDTLRPRVGSSQTQVGSVSGTPAYMSPEQARGETKKLGPPTDVYALGAILYEILSGSAPFKGASSAEILEQVREHEPKERLLLDRIPTHLKALCESAMQRDLDDRTLSAQALAQGLKDWLEGAEKRDKGLKELESARQVLAEIQQLENQAESEWKQANALIQSEGAESKAGWKSWNKTKATQDKIRALRVRHRRRLQGALVHAPKLEEAHNALGELVLADIVRAHALGDVRTEGVLLQQFTGHLDHLGPLDREKWETQLEIGRSDPIAGRRMRQGAIVGRRAQRQSIGEYFRSGNRLITLLGTAGVGKTRLALEVAEDLHDLEHKVTFCDLTEATDAMGIGRRLARAMDVRLRDMDPMVHLCEILSAERTLLILDNLEQVQAIIGPLIQEWIGQTNHLLILATSRARLMVEIETVVAIQPLALLESVELFLARGQTADQRFALTPDNRIQVCHIVHQLDGLPLAIELAAARLKLLTLDEIASHLDNRFGLLRSGGKDARALDTALDWSWSLLEPWAKAALAQASLFQGGFNLAAATGVIQKGEIKDAPEIFDVLGGLVDNSLLRLEHNEAGVRYSLLESIRAYANNKLSDPTEGDPSLWGPEARVSAQHHHAAYFSKLGKPASLRALKGFKSSAQWDGLFLELDNLVAAIDYGTPESAPLCCLAALKVLGMKGPVALGVDIATQVMQMPGLNRRSHSLLEIERGKCLRISGRMGEARSMVHSLPPAQPVAVEAESETKAEEPELLSREAELVEAERLMELGNIERAENKYAEAEHCFLNAIEIYQKHGDRAEEGAAIGNLGNVYQSKGELDRAAEHFNQAIKIAQKVGNNKSEGIHLGNLGLVYQKQGQHDRAVEHFTRAINIASEIGNKRNESLNRGNLGCSYREKGQYGQAVEHYTQALNIAREIGDKRTEGIHVGNLGYLYFKMQQLDEAEDAFRKAILICDEACPPAAGAFRASLALLLAQKGQLDEAQALLETGEPQVATYPIEHAKFLCKKGQVQLLAGEPEAAQKSLDQAKAIAAEHKFGDDGEVAEAIAELTALLRSSDEPDEPSGEEREDALIEAVRLVELGHIERTESKYAEAERCYRSALELFQQHNDRAREAIPIGNLGIVYQEQGQNDRAIEHFTQALDIAQEIGNKRHEGIYLGNLGGIYQVQGQYDRAVEHLTQAIDIAQEIGDKRFKGINLGNLGGIYQVQGQYDRAVEHYTQAVNIAREIGNKRFEGINLGNLGGIYQVQRHYDRAVEHFTQALDIAREVGDKRHEVIHLGNLGDAFVKMEQLDKAEEAFRKAIPIGDEIYPIPAGVFRGSLALLLAQQDQIKEAQALLETGEPQVATYPSELVKFLCKKGQVQLLAGEPEAAQKSLDQAKAIATEHKFGADGEVAQAIAELCALLGSSDEPNEPDEPDEDREDALIEAERLMELGNIEFNESKYVEAEKCFSSALEIFQKHCDRAGEGEAIGSLGIVYQAQGQNDQAGEHYTQAIDIAREIGNKRSEGVNLGNLGNVYGEHGQHDLAAEHYTQALDIAREIGNKCTEGIHLGSLGLLYKNQGQHDLAVEHYTQSIDIAREIGDKRSEGINLGNLGGVYREQKQHERAVEHFTQAIDIAREIGDKLFEGINLNCLGIVYQEQGQHDRAVEYFTQAIQIAKEIGNKRFEGINLGNLGDAFVKIAQLDKAEEAFSKAILMCDEILPPAAGAFRGSLALLLARKNKFDETQTLLEIGESQVATYPLEHAKFLCKKGQVQLLAGEPEAAQKALDQAKAIAAEHKFGDDGEVAEAIAELTALLDSPNEPDEPLDEEREDALIEAARLMELGNIERAESKYAEAEQCYRSAMEIFQKHSDRAGEGGTIGSLGNVYQEQGQYDRAAEHYTQAINIAQEIGDKRGEGISLSKLGGIYEEQGQYDRAAEHFTQAIDIAREIGDKRFEGIHLGNLGIIYQGQEQHDRAVEHFTQAIDITKEIGDKRSEGIFLGHLGIVSKKQGQYDQAAEHYTQAIDIAREVGDKRNEGIFLGNLGNSYQEQGQHDRAVEHFTQAIDIAREIGDKRNESMHLGNLGDILFQQNRLKEAEDAFREAIAIGDETFPLAAGAFRGSLAVLIAQKGQFDEAQALLETGEPQVANYPLEHAKLLCKKGQVQLLSGESKASQESLDQAKAIAAEHKLGADGEAAQPINELTALLRPPDEPDDEEREDALIEAARLMELGRLEEAESKYVEAKQCYHRALEIFQKHGDRAGEGEAIGNLGFTYREQGLNDQAVEHFIQALDIAREIGDKRFEGIHLGKLGIIYQDQGQQDRAVEHFTQAIKIAREIGDKGSEGKNLGNLGDTFVKIAQLDKAEDAFRKAIPINDKTFPAAAGAFRGSLALLLAQQDQIDEAQALLEIGESQVTTHPKELAKFLCKKGQVQLLAGELKAAKESLCHAQELAAKQNADEASEAAQAIAELTALLESPDEDREDALIEAARLMELGNIERVESKYAGAKQCFSSALEIFQKHGDRAGEGEANGYIGNVYREQGQHELAVEHYTQAIDIAREVGNKENEGISLGNLGNAYQNQGQNELAVEHYTQAIDIAREIGNKSSEGVFLGNLGNVYRFQGQFELAVEHHTQAINIAREIGNKENEGINLGNLGTVHQNKGGLDSAIVFYTQAIDIAREIGNKRSENIHLGHLGEIYRIKGDLDSAMELYTQAIDIAREIDDKRTEGFHLGAIGSIHQGKGELELAAELYSQVIDIARENGDKRTEFTQLGNLGDILFLQKRIEAAEDAFRKAIPICDKTDQAAAGAFRASLALLCAQKGHSDEVQELLKIGEPQVTDYPSEYAKFLCKKGQVQHLAGTPEAAKKSLDQAKELATQHKLEKDGEVAQEISALESLLESPDEEPEDALIKAERLMELGNIEQAESKYAEAERCYLNASAIFQKHSDRAGEGAAIGNLGSVYQHQGQHDRAVEHLTQAIDIAREMGNKSSEGTHLGNLGMVYQNQGQYDRAIKHFTQAIDIAREMGNKRTEGGHLGSLGIVYQNQGQHDRAVEHFTQAIDIAREMGNKSSEGIHLGNLGGVYREQGRHDWAAKHFTRAIDIAKEIGNKSNEGIQLGNLGNVYKEQGQHDRAAEHFTQAIDIAREIGAKHSEGINLGNLGLVYQNQGQYDRAVAHYTQAIDIAREIGDKRTEGSHLGNLGDMLFQQNRLEEAEDAFRKSIPIGDETFPIAAGAFRASLALLLAQQGQFDEAQELLKIGEPQVATYPSELAKFLCKKGQVQLLEEEPQAAKKSLGQAKALASKHGFGDDSEVAEAIAELTALLDSPSDPDEPDEEREDALIEAERLMELGKIEQAESKYPEAERCYLSALELFQQHGNRTGEGETFGYLGGIYHNQGKLDRAGELYTQAIDIAREVGNKKSEATILGNFGIIYLNQGSLDRAGEFLTQAISMTQEIGDKLREGAHLGNLGNVYRHKGELDRAVALHTQAITIAREIGDKSREGVHLSNLGNIYQQKLELDRAAEHYTQAIDIARKIGDKHSEGINLGNLGAILAYQNRPEKAEEAFRKAIPIGDETFPVSAGFFRGSLALLLAKKGQCDDAYELLKVGESLLAPYPDAQARLICKKGQVHILAGKPEAAQRALNQAKALVTEHKLENDVDVAEEIAELTALLESPDEPDKPDEEREDALIEAARLLEMGNIERAESKYPEAEKCYHSAIEIYQKHGDRADEGETIGLLGNVYREQGQHDRAAEHYTQAVDIAREIGNKRSEGIHLGNLGDMLFQQNRLEEAEDAFRRAILISDEACRPAAGAFRASLALLLTQQGQLDEAQDLLKIGEPQVKTYPAEHAKFLSKKGQAQFLTGAPEAAVESLNQANTIATEHKLGDDLEVAQAISKLTALLGSPDEPADEDREDALIKAARLMELGNIEREESKYAEAQRCYLSALVLFQQHDDRAGEGEAIGNLGNIYREKGEWEQTVKHFTQAVDIAREIGNKHSEGLYLGNLGLVYQDKGELDRAAKIFTQAIDIAREIGARLIEGFHLGNLGNIYLNKGELGQAGKYLTQSIDIAREIGDKKNEGIHLGNLALVYQHKGEIHRAVERYTQAIDIAREIGDKRSEGFNLGNLGDMLFQQNRLEEAENAFRKAIPIGNETFPEAAGAFRGSLALLLAQQDQFDEAHTLLESGEPQVATYPKEHAKFLCRKGRVQLLADEPKAAQGSLGQAKALVIEHKFGADVEVAQAIAELTALLSSPDEPDDPEDLAEAAGEEREEREDALIEAARLMELGQIERHEGNYLEAERCYLSAIEIFQKNGDRTEEGEAHGQLGSVFHDQGKLDQATKQITQAIDIARETGNSQSEGIALGTLGNLYQRKGELSSAAALFTQAIYIAREIGDKILEGNTLGSLGSVYQNKGETDRAASHYTLAIDIAREIGDKRREGINLGNLAGVYAYKGELDRAIEIYTQTLDIARAIGNKRGEGIHLGNLGDILFQQHQFEKAKDAFREAIAISDEACPPAAGAFRGSLALLLTQKGQRDEAQSLLESGESQVKAYPSEHAKFLCKKGHVQFLIGEHEAAQESLSLVKALMTSHKLQAESDVKTAIGALEALLESPETAAKWSGENRENAPSGVAQESLEQAKAVVAKHNLGDDAEATQAISALEALLGSMGKPGESSDKAHEDALIEAARLMELGIIEQNEGEYPKANQCFSAAIALFQTHNDHAGEGEALGHLGTLYRHMGELDQAAEHLKQAIHIARKFGHKQAEGVNLGGLALIYHDQCELDRAIKLYTQVIDIAREIGDKVLEGNTLGSLGTVFNNKGDHDQAVAHLNQSIEIAREIGDKRREGLSLGNLGLVHLNKGDNDQAVAHYTQALRIAREIGDKRNVGNNLGNLGNAYKAKGETEQAIKHYTQAIDIAREIGNKRGEGLHLGYLGKILCQKNRLREAEDALREAISIGDQSFPASVNVFRNALAQLLEKKDQVQCLSKPAKDAQEVGKGETLLESAGPATQSPPEDREDILIEANRLMALGQIEDEEAKYPAAESCYLSAIKIFEQQGDRTGKGEALGYLGNVYINKGEMDRAGELFTQAIDIAREMGDKETESINLGNAGNISLNKGELDRAAALFTQALDIAREIGNEHGEGIHLSNLGNIYRQMGDLNRGRSHYTQALNLARKIGNKRSEGSSLANLGSTYLLKGELDLADSHYTQALKIAQEIGNKRSETLILTSLGIIYLNRGDLDQAGAHHIQALKIAQEIGDRYNEGINLGNLGDILFQQDRLEEAEDAFRKAIPISDDTCPPAAGAFRGSLAQLLAQKDQCDEAQELLKIGEPQVTAFRNEHAKFLCKKGHVQLLASGPEAAQTVLRQVKVLVTTHKLGEDSEVAQAISALEDLLSRSD